VGCEVIDVVKDNVVASDVDEIDEDSVVFGDKVTTSVVASKLTSSSS
jgi:hypothetical protein